MNKRQFVLLMQGLFIIIFVLIDTAGTNRVSKLTMGNLDMWTKDFGEYREDDE